MKKVLVLAEGICWGHANLTWEGLASHEQNPFERGGSVMLGWFCTHQPKSPTKIGIMVGDFGCFWHYGWFNFG